MSIENKKDKIASVKRVKELLSMYNLKAKKSFGQNFLIKRSVVDEMVDCLDLQESDLVLEIGPGLGAVTEALLEQKSKVVAVELDRDMAHILEETLQKEYRSLEIINEDFLETKWERLNATKIVGNLPYYISTPILMEIIRKESPWQKFIFTLQWEVVQKLVASPSNKSYNALSSAVQCFGTPKVIKKLPPHFFLPQPDVHSGVVLIERKDLDLDNRTLNLLWQILDNAYQTRRKTLQNNLSGILPQGFRSSLDLTKRAEQFAADEFIILAKELSAYISRQ